MKILVIGGGGREHALTWKFAQDAAGAALFCAPGNAGTAQVGVNLDLQAEDVPALLAWAKRERPELTVVGPEAPLCAGIVDSFQAVGLRVFGPSQTAARLEGSKMFAKEILLAAGIPTAQAQSFTAINQALDHLRSARFPLVIKADGLAAGKGVSICLDRQQAQEALQAALVTHAFAGAGRQVLIEDYLEGEEVSVLALVDGKRAVLLPSAQDHKRVMDGDRGPNTGGMGAYSPAPMENAAWRKSILEQIFNPTLKELEKRDIQYHGVLYAGLILTANGPYVLEFNCRFGDPETQAILPRLTSDLIPALEACIDGTLEDDHVRWSREDCACVVMAAGGYPGQYHKGDLIEGLPQASTMKDVCVFHAGTRDKDGQIVTNGGRVLGVTALGVNLAAAASTAYEAVRKISFPGAYYRRDIGARGLKRNKI